MPRGGETRVEWRGGAAYTARAIPRRKKRIADPGKGRAPTRERERERGGGGGSKEYETEQLKLGTVPARAYNIRQKFVSASRPPGRSLKPRSFDRVHPLAALIWHRSEGG